KFGSAVVDFMIFILNRGLYESIKFYFIIRLYAK
ncbi:MAG: hypothetical protein ACI9AT_000516, partial [Ulvibacter sp.]